MELTRRANSRTNRAEDARRARLIWLLAEGHAWDEVSERIDCSRGFVASWSKRIAEQRIAGLYSRHLGQVTTVLTRNWKQGFWSEPARASGWSNPLEHTQTGSSSACQPHDGGTDVA